MPLSGMYFMFYHIRSYGDSHQCLDTIHKRLKWTPCSREATAYYRGDF